jgi:hypothetical protein
MTATLDTRTEAERRYDAERSGAAWLKVQAITDDPTNDGSEDAIKLRILQEEQARRAGLFGKLKEAAQEMDRLHIGIENFPADIRDNEACLRWMNEQIATARWELAQRQEPFGVLADGTQIMGEYNEGERWGVVCVEVGTWLITADDAGYFSFGNGRFDIQEVTRADLVQLCDLLNSGVFDHLHATAVAWERGDTEPSTPRR